MGMDRTVRFPSGAVPGWDAIRVQLDRLGLTASLRMIDGLPAFPDEVPDPGWKELRVGVAGGMVTVRAGVAALTCVVWGNAGDEVRARCDAVCWACAAAAAGVIETPAGPVAPDEFARAAGIRPT